MEPTNELGGTTMPDVYAADSDDLVHALSNAWWLLLVFGVVTIGFGIVLTFKPGHSVHVIAVIFGIWLLILGAVRLIQAIGRRGERTGLVVVGLVSILVALLLLRHTSTTIDTVGFIIGIFWTIGGVAQLVAGFDAEGGIDWWFVLLGVISTIVGILCLVYPSLSLSIICVIIGLGLIVYGIVEVVASFQLRKLDAT
jgi:uncharacterized membrane protein HdeD (DUF308 family)